VIAKLADAESLLRAHGRTKDPAGNGTRKVQVTKAGGGIECRTRLIIGEVFETRLRLLRWIQQPGRWIAWKTLREPLDRSPRTLANGFGAFRITAGKLSQSLLKTGRIELMDGEDAHATLRATGPANQPLSAAPGGVRQRGVENLH
jgi:hypothetical protein